MAQAALVANRASQAPGSTVVRLSVTGGITSLSVFVACWLGAQMPALNPTHAYISLFTTAEVSSVAALLAGGLWSLVFGAFAVGLFGLVYNLAAPLTRR